MLMHEEEPEKNEKEEMKYSCTYCEYSTTKARYLKIHTDRLHEGMWYPCNLCDYTANTRRSLKVHIEIKHEGVRYPCNQCEYVSTRP